MGLLTPMNPIIQLGSSMIRSKLLLLILLLFATLGISIRTEEARLRRQRARTTAVALQLENAVAARDSTRDVALENGTVARLLGDSLRLVEKRVVQIAQKADVLDDVLHRERVAKYELNATIESLRQSIAAASTTSAHGDARSATFNVRQEPFTVSAEVEMPPPPDSATLYMRIHVDPLNVLARVTCSPADPNGVRMANVSTASPPWADVKLAQLEQTPEVCNSMAISQPDRARRLRFAPLVLAAGRSIGKARQCGWVVLIGSGVAIRL
jgi:hypothetical protein